MSIVTFTYMDEHNYRHIGIFPHTSNAIVHPFFISNFNQVYASASPGFSFTHKYYICVFIHKFDYIHPDWSRFFELNHVNFEKY